jgi:hypothetical protein
MQLTAPERHSTLQLLAGSSSSEQPVTNWPTAAALCWGVMWAVVKTASRKAKNCSKHVKGGKQFDDRIDADKTQITNNQSTQSGRGQQEWPK